MTPSSWTTHNSSPIFSLETFRTCESINSEVADWFPHQTISTKRKKIASLIARLSGSRRGSTKLPVLSPDVPVQQRLREVQDRVKAMRRIRGIIDIKMPDAMGWLQDPDSGGTGEEGLRVIIKMTLRVAERSLPSDTKRLRDLADDMSQKLRNELTINRTSGVVFDI